MKNRSLPAQLFAGLLLAVVALPLTACNLNIIYRLPASNYSGRPIPPSGLLQRVLASYNANGFQGGLEILDGLRDLRGNVQNTIPEFNIKGFSGSQPVSIINFPEQTTGYVLSYTDGSLVTVNYSTEASTGTAAGFGAEPPSVAAAPGGVLFAGAAESAGVLGISGPFGPISLNLPNVDKVVVNPSATIILAMVRNSNQLYRVVKLPATSTPTYPPGYIDCQPILLPVYCVVPVGNTSSAGTQGGAYDHPSNAVFSADGTSVYILNCGPECGGTTAGVTVLQQSPLLMQTVPTQDPLCGENGHLACTTPEPSPLASLPVPNPIPVPGGATVGLSDGATLFLAGQQQQSNGLFAGFLTLLNQTTYTVGAPISISDGNHTKMLFADNGTLWIGSSQCANGQRAYNAAHSVTDQTANYNCLTRYVRGSVYDAATNVTPPSILPAWSPKAVYQPGQKVCDSPATLSNAKFETNNQNEVVCDAGNIHVVLTGGTSGSSNPTWNQTLDGATTDGTVTWVDVGANSPVQIIPIVTPNNPTSLQPVSASNPINTNITVPYPNTNLSSNYYGTLYGECWVQNYGKIYTAYGGQIHAFETADGFEINNFNITIQGTVFDVAYMDAESNSAN